MQTTCPECRTTFRVSQEHLGIRRGLVRCGHCNAVFNAYDTLLPELAEPPAAALADANADAAAHVPLPEEPHWQEIEPMPAAFRVQALAKPLPDLPKAGVATEATEAAEAKAETSESILLSQMPGRLLPARPAGKPVGKPAAKPVGKPVAKPARWKTVLYGFAIALASGLLLLQSAYFLRAGLAAAIPASRPVLTALCAPLGCRVPLPRLLTRQAIVASSLEHDPEQKSRVRLTFLLANRTSQTQAWPDISLTLSDVREAPVARKVFSPASYLSKDAAIGAGIPAGSERETRLELDIGNLAASGYALDLFYR